jgi:hypothetical protein
MYKWADLSNLKVLLKSVFFSAWMKHKNNSPSLDTSALFDVGTGAILNTNNNWSILHDCPDYSEMQNH